MNDIYIYVLITILYIYTYAGSSYALFLQGGPAATHKLPAQEATIAKRSKLRVVELNFHLSAAGELKMLAQKSPNLKLYWKMGSNYISMHIWYIYIIIYIYIALGFCFIWIELHSCSFLRYIVIRIIIYHNIYILYCAKKELYSSM